MSQFIIIWFVPGGGGIDVQEDKRLAGWLAWTVNEFHEFPEQPHSSILKRPSYISTRFFVDSLITSSRPRTNEYTLPRHLRSRQVLAPCVTRWSQVFPLEWWKRRKQSWDWSGWWEWEKQPETWCQSLTHCQSFSFVLCLLDVMGESINNLLVMQPGLLFTKLWHWNRSASNRRSLELWYKKRRKKLYLWNITE